MSKPVQVYILLGQSNMVGMGHVDANKGKDEGSLKNAVKNGKYPYLVDDAGNWTERKDVRYVRVMGSGTGAMKQFNNEWMTIKGGTIGPEYGIGAYVGEAVDAPVMILKSCIGNRSLGWDLLPPGSKGFEFQDKGKTWVYAGYKESPMRWEKGTQPDKSGGWYAGTQYDGDIANAKKVLSELDKYYPGAKGYEVAGFFFWQGDKDRYDAGLAARYEQNLVAFIESLRKDFDAPNAKFVCATLGQTAKGAGGTEGKILEAQMAVDGRSGKYPQFKGNVATVYTKPVCLGGSSNAHYNGNAETYMNVGEEMGKAMVELLGAQTQAVASKPDAAAPGGGGAAESPASEYRQWTSVKGLKFEARVVEFKDGKVLLNRRAGGPVRVDEDRLCEADRQYLAAWKQGGSE
ncbi:MAG: sialate O-acetylesterase [Phycisphaera sp.]|nr:sialate O-acetylesterase [Phycisphaera sp.]